MFTTTKLMQKTTEKDHYIKLIFLLQEKQQRVTVSKLAKVLGVSKSSVSNMMKKLINMGWVDTKPYKPIRLTELGEHIALELVAKHRLVESFLCEMMHFTSDEVHEIAEELEHVNSPVFFRRIKEMLSQIQKDPHGSSIPEIDF